MSTTHEPLGVYLHLARASQQRRRPLVRDKMLVLAGAVAAERGLQQVAACCRQRVLEHNAGHLLGQYSGFAQALQDERFQILLRKLRRDFSLERAEHMLTSLGIELAGERQTYYTDHEYAASLLGLSAEELEQRFALGEPTTPSPLKSAVIARDGKLGPENGPSLFSAASILIALAALGGAAWLLRWFAR